MLSQLPNYTTVLINCELNSVVAIGCRVMCAGRKTSRATFKEYGMSPQGACRKPNALYVRMNECTKFGKRFFVFCHYKLIIASFIKNSKKKISRKTLVVCKRTFPLLFHTGSRFFSACFTEATQTRKDR